MQAEDWLQIEETTFKARFKKSPLLRSKLKGIQRNIQFLKEQEDKFLRLYAEFENYRRRSAREKAEYLSSASQEMIMAMLPILDDFERASKNNENVTDISVVKEGFHLIYTKLGQILEAKGLKPIDAMSQPFDYNLHEAIANVPVEDEALKGKVIDQVEKGYYLNEKVIRFAKVAVGQ